MITLLVIIAIPVVIAALIYMRWKYEKQLKASREKKRTEKKAILWMFGIFVFCVLLKALDHYVSAPYMNQ